MLLYLNKILAGASRHRSEVEVGPDRAAQARDRLRQHLCNTPFDAACDAQAAQSFWLDMFASESRRSGLGLTAAPAGRLGDALRRGLLSAAQLYSARPTARAHPLPEMPRPLPCCEALLDEGYRLVEHTLGDPELPYDLRLLVADAASHRVHAFLTSCDRIGNASGFFAGLLQWPRPGRDCMLDPARFDADALTQLLASLHGVPAAVAYDTCVELASLIDFLVPTPRCVWQDLARQCRACFAAVPVCDSDLGAVLLRLAAAGPAVAHWAQPLVAQVAGLPAAARLRLPLQAVRLVVDEHPSRWLPDNCLRWVRDYADHYRAEAQSAAQYLRQSALLHSPAWAELPVSTLRRPSVQALFDDSAYGRLARRRDLQALPATCSSHVMQTSGIYNNSRNCGMGCRARIDDFVAWFDSKTAPQRLEADIDWRHRTWNLSISKAGIFLRKQEGQKFLAGMRIILRDSGGANGDCTLGFAPLDFLPGQKVGFLFGDHPELLTSFSRENTPWMNPLGAFHFEVHLHWGPAC